MTERYIKNDKWYVKDLVSKVFCKILIKDKYQRKRKWDTIPKSENVPNERSFIEFLFKNKNTVFPITFGQNIVNENVFYSNIDGNNRINAVLHFMLYPFEIFDFYLDDLMNILNQVENTDEIKDIFKSMSYNDFINIRRPDRFFKSIERNDLFEQIKDLQNDLDDEIEKVQKKLKINEEDNFDLHVQINVNIFVGYTISELAVLFEQINKFNSRLTETELLASRLYPCIDFVIHDNVFKTNLQNSIKEYYESKAVDEILQCYVFNPLTDDINAYDFIVGFQNHCSKIYKFIGKTEMDGLSLFFKLYKALYGGYDDTFTTENINDFIKCITYACDVMNKSISNIFTDKINNKLFNTSCKEKLQTLKKNNIFMLISSIIGYSRKRVDESIIIQSIERCLLFHFFISDLKNKEIREEYKNYDSITYRAGGGFIDNTVKNLLTNPEQISVNVTKERFRKLINYLLNETNVPYVRKLENGKNKYDKRRILRFFEKTLMFYFYKGKIPIDILSNSFSIEHIFPNSSEWSDKLDKDRTGNLIPIISSINCSRGNKHITHYKKTREGEDFCKYIKDIIPFHEYDNVISHSDGKPIILNNDLFNIVCDANEKKYNESFIKSLFD